MRPASASDTLQLLRGRHAAVFGFASQRSLAWGVARAWQAAGCSVAFALRSERFRPALDALTAHWPAPPTVVYCDLASDAELERACAALGAAAGGRVDALLHSVAYASKAALAGRVLDVSREDYHRAQDVSAYSLIALARGFAPFMARASAPAAADDAAAAPPAGAAAAADTPVAAGDDAAPSEGSIITMSYIGAERVIPGYKIMGVAKAALETTVRYLAEDLGPLGIRINTISAGPIDTLASRGIPGFSALKQEAVQRSPMRRGISLGDVGGAATYLASGLSSGVTGQTLYVDQGYHIR